MKGVIPLAMRAMIEEQYGLDKWHEVIAAAGYQSEPFMLPISDIADEEVMKLVLAMCQVVPLTLSEFADRFGVYWVGTYALRVYSGFYKSEEVKTARAFLLQMDWVHEATTKRMKNARPPRFQYRWESEDILIITYQSHRPLIDLLVGLIRGVGVYFGEALDVRRLNDTEVRVHFPAPI